jgi:Uma2 family endonuclease
MNWQEVCEHPSLQDLPFKIELNHWGQIIMVPAKNSHSMLQGEIIVLLASFMGKQGRYFAECAIQTTDNVKVADVAWMSDSRLAQVKDEAVYSIAPEICVEVMSPSNTKAEMTQKKKLYFAAGAQEVWICEASGKLNFYTELGKIAQSALVPNFPQQVEIE